MALNSLLHGPIYSRKISPKDKITRLEAEMAAALQGVEGRSIACACQVIGLFLPPAINHPGIETEVVLDAAAIITKEISRRYSCCEIGAEVIVNGSRKAEAKGRPVVVEAEIGGRQAAGSGVEIAMAEASEPLKADSELGFGINPVLWA